MRILAIDAGTTESAIVAWDSASKKLGTTTIAPNDVIRAGLWDMLGRPPDVLAIEMVACYGMAVGKEVFETCVWVGRFYEAGLGILLLPRLIYRRDVKLHHCQSARAKDANVRQALIDKYGPPGTKKAPGVTYGLKSHLWAAFAIATFISETDSADRGQELQNGKR